MIHPDRVESKKLLSESFGRFLKKEFRFEIVTEARRFVKEAYNSSCIISEGKWGEFNVVANKNDVGAPINEVGQGNVHFPKKLRVF